MSGFPVFHGEADRCAVQDLLRGDEVEWEAVPGLLIELGLVAMVPGYRGVLSPAGLALARGEGAGEPVGDARALPVRCCNRRQRQEARRDRRREARVRDFGDHAIIGGALYSRALRGVGGQAPQVHGSQVGQTL